MFKVVTIENMRKIEAAADASGISYATMMQNAGRAAADRALHVLSGINDARVTVLVGGGNNGGDGLVAGHLIAQESSAQVRFYLLKRRDTAHDSLFKIVQDAGLFIAHAEDDQDHRVIRNLISSADLVMDALFGIGARLPIKGAANKLLRSINQALNEKPTIAPIHAAINPAQPNQFHQSARPFVLALDCPSGLDCDTGALDTNAVHAHETITFIAAKPGLFLFPGAQAVGQLSIAPIGIPPELKSLQEETITILDSETVRQLLPPRPINSSKGTFGKVMIAAGSINYMGAPALAAEAAYRVGAGLVTVGAPQPVINTLAAQLREPTWLLLPHDMGVIAEQAASVLRKEVQGYNALLVGPGIGTENTTRAFFTGLLKQNETQRIDKTMGFMRDTPAAAPQTPPQLPPLVIDADGLNALSTFELWWQMLPKDTILTPHPGEMGRLAQLETIEVQNNRWALAQRKAAEWRVVLVLKGAHTLIAAPDGRLSVLPFKTDALAKAGTGDVLAGMIAGLRAQGLPAFEAAAAGAYLHGLAGQFAAQHISSRSVTAGDILNTLGAVLKQVETI